MTTTSHLPLPGRRTWWRLCACPDCNNAGPTRRQHRKRRAKRAEHRRTQREIDTERYEEP